MPFLSTCPGCKTELRIREEYVGKKLKCPRCSEVLTVPAAKAEPVVEQVFDAQIIAPPASSVAIRAELVEVEAVGSRRRCPRCNERLRMDDERCPRCRLRLDDDSPRQRKLPDYRPCPRCGGEEPTRITWTPWGSFYGPALFNHVRCRECGYGYNGLNGRSNLIPAIFFVAVPAILIVAIIVALLYTLGVFRIR